MTTLLTGASGFLGKYIYAELFKYGKVTTISRNYATINVNLAKEVPTIPIVDIVVHCVGKAHSVPKNAEESQVFYDVNVKGTANLLTAIQNNESLPSAFVFISTVAVYGCGYGLAINEEHPLIATDPYGKSKILAENLIKEWCAKNEVTCSILRLPLLVGENPPGNLGAMINGIRKGYYFNLAGGKAKKSMVLANDVAKIIPTAAEIGGVYNLTDGYNPSFLELSENISMQLGKSKPFNLPIQFAKLIGMMGDLIGEKFPINSSKLQKITSDLTFDDSLARQKLGWNPSPVLEGFKIT
ncbi:NAD-dependent epimerase/dehydratase family protein [Pedobacter sp. MW01-1-1]|uniref:NAD-dependent epimerase/dehydratase family protein n=1 Tax=Pedobacter sp. MW01-1-1 TaxID=3383027 RepID=UPI003FEFB139